MSKLMSPIELGGVKIKNRVFLPGHTTNFGQNNLPTDRNITYLSTRAAGGVGLIISEAIRVHPTSAGRNSTLGAFDDQCIPSFKKLTSAVHKNGAVLFAQIMHAGRQANGEATHTAAWSSSAIPWTRGGQVPHAMSYADINSMVKAFGKSAARMKSAGFDGLEIHLGHGHLIQQFLSPASNQRTDRYGGSLDNRMRFAIEVLTEIYQSVPNLGVGVRISADEFLPNGLNPGQMVEIVGKLTVLFDLSFLHVSHAAYHGSWTLSTQIADMSFGHAPYRQHAAIFKGAFPNLPILAVCRLDTLVEAAELLDANEADMVGLVRPHIADPEIVNKFNSGRAAEITSCIACNQECIGRVEKNLPISCAVNPEVGAEKKWQEIRSVKQIEKKVLIIGGGPAGMTAALSADTAGHKVTLIEGSGQLGGQVLIASSLIKRQRFGLLVQDLEKRILDSNIKLRFHTYVSDMAKYFPNFDKIILATGASSMTRNFGDGAPVISAETAINKYCQIQSTNNEVIVIIDEEGTWIAGSIAEQLATNGYQVHLVSPTASLFGQITIYSKLALIPRLKELGVQIHLACEVNTDNKNTIIKNSMSEQRLEISDCLTIVDCGPRKANDELYQAVQIDEANRIQIIGDALSPRSVAEATFEGNAIGVFLDLDLALSTLENQ